MTLAIIHTHFLMNKESFFGMPFEKRMKVVLNEPLRDIQTLLNYQNIEPTILAFNTAEGIEDQLLEILT